MNKLLNRNQSGAAHLAIIIAVVVVVIGAAGYFVWSKNKDKTTSGSNNSNLTQEEKAANEALLAGCKEEVGDDDFCKYAANSLVLFGNKVSYKSVSTGSLIGDGTESYTTTAEYDDKGNYHLSTDTPSGKSESIRLGDTTYTKGPGQSVWYRQKDSASTDTQEDDQSEAPDYDFDKSEESGPKTIYKKLGTEACGKLTCIKYQTYSEDSPEDTYTVWFDTKDFLTRKSEVKSSDGALMTTTYSYEKVTITEPSPVEDMPDYSQMTPEQLQELAKQYGAEQ